MANARLLPPFIKSKEGKLSKNPADLASKNPCPYEFNGITGWHTNVGITWPVWVSIFGDTQASANRFFAMDDDDWFTVFKKLFWDAAFGDDIISQRIANMIVDWCWGSGIYYPEKTIQDILNHIHSHLVEDGEFGPATVAQINDTPEEELYCNIIAAHEKFITDLVEAKPSQEEFLNGWLARMQSLVDFNKTNFKLQ